MEWIERGGRMLFKLLFGILFSGVFLMLALETAVRRLREDRRIATEPPVTDLEAIYRNRVRGGLVAAAGLYQPRSATVAGRNSAH